MVDARRVRLQGIDPFRVDMIGAAGNANLTDAGPVTKYPARGSNLLTSTPGWVGDLVIVLTRVFVGAQV
jgi:hypothetical protein